MSIKGSVNIYEKRNINYAELDTEMKIAVGILEGLDSFTNAHIQGVADNTAKLCDVLDLSYEKTRELIFCAYLHDIGKIRVPSEILQKQTKLNEEEFEIMKKHTIWGYEMCMANPNFVPYANVVRGHHECLDGSGYPDGLVDKQIDEKTKLIKVADIYDALTQRRQYKDGFAPSKAFEIMLGDVKKGKTGAKYIYYLMTYIIEEFRVLIEEQKTSLKLISENLETLKELEEIYKNIYNVGFKPKYRRMLEHYNLSRGYDISQNEVLLANNKKNFEHLTEKLRFYKIEYKKLKKLKGEAFRRTKLKEWFAKI